MAVITSILIVAFCLYLVITPLLTKKGERLSKDIYDDTDEISLSSVYATLNELEMDYHMQKLSDEDYQRLKSQYEHLAAGLLKKQKNKTETNKTSTNQALIEIEAEIEQELAKLRKERGAK